MSLNLQRFHGKSVLVTGGATGVGYAAAHRFALEGARVVITGRRHEVGANAEQSLRAEGLDVRFVAGDVADESSVKRMIGQTIDLHGKIDILVNNAAIANSIRFLGADRVKWKQVFDVIVDGTYFCTQEAALHMVAAGIKGHIVNVSSINGSRALEQSSHYNAAKGAMDQLTRNTALELIDHGIRVNGLSLGFIDTPMSVVDGENELESDWFRSIYVERGKIPQRRAAQPAEVAAAIAFLASEDASYICGAVIPVDGGLSITF